MREQDLASELAALNRELEERNQALEAQAAQLKKTELWASMALENGRMAFWQYDYKTRERFWSPLMYEIFEQPPGEGPPPLERMLERIHPADRPRFAAGFAGVLQGRAPEELEFRIVSSGGEMRWLTTRARVVPGADGELESLCGLTWDTTQRRVQEEQSRKNEEIFRALNFACPVGIFRASLEGAVEYVNPRYNQICGLEDGEALGFGFRKRVHPEDLRKAMREFLRSVRQRREVGINFRLLLPDGSVRWVHVRAVPVGKEEQAYLVGTIEDVTFAYLDAEELRDAKNAAEKADRAKSDFLANMSHEIRTPLNGALAALSLLADSPLMADQRELVEIARGSGTALLELLSDILDLTKAELGTLTIERKPFDLGRTIRDAVEVFRCKAAEKHLALRVSIGPAVPGEAVGDSARVRQIVLNFMSNAVKFTERGEIEVSARVVNRDMVRVAVSDTGIGVPEHARDCLFVRFAQADTSSTRRFGGSGLGLAICKQLSELMGGSVGFESEVGRGSIFWVDLPLRPR